MKVVGHDDEGVELIAALVRHAENVFGSGEGGLIGRERQRTLLRETAASLQCSMEEKGEELVAEDLRAAAHSLGRLLGRVRDAAHDPKYVAC